MMNIIIDMQRCRSEMAIMATKLPDNLNIPRCMGPVCQIMIPLGKSPEENVYELSLVIPADAMGNRSVDNEEYPTAAETALFCDGSITYVPDWGYDDVVRWYSGRASDDENIAKILEEIERLKGLVSGAVVPEEDDYSDEDAEIPSQ